MMFRFSSSRLKSILFVLILGISGCSVTADEIESMYNQPGWPGYLTKDVSEFDGKSRVSLEPAYLSDATSMLRLGLRWNSSLPKDKLVFVAAWGEAKNFDPNSPFKLNIDGSMLELKPLDNREYGITTSSYASYNQTEKRFWISKSDVSRIVDAQKVVVRVELLKTYWEERLEPTPKVLSTYKRTPSVWAKVAFAKFLSEQSSI